MTNATMLRTLENRPQTFSTQAEIKRLTGLAPYGTYEDPRIAYDEILEAQEEQTDPYYSNEYQDDGVWVEF